MIKRNGPKVKYIRGIDNFLLSDLKIIFMSLK